MPNQREAFEGAQRTQWNLEDTEFVRDGDGYASPLMNDDWDLWQAATERAAGVAERTVHGFDADSDYERGMRNTARRIAAAIREGGE